MTLKLTKADLAYTTILRLTSQGDHLVTRNAEVRSCIDLPRLVFDEAPLVTVRKTAAMKAIREMEWFVSGDSRCPDDLLDWWRGQLSPGGALISGYGEQLRYSGNLSFDQVEFTFKSLRTNPNSRRLVMTVWNPTDMAFITDLNGNPNTPTCCHSIVIQFFVREGALHMTSYQRSADLLLGAPHNWIQSWALLVWFAYHAHLKVGTMSWMFGDAHIYQEESHVRCVDQLLGAVDKAEDFEIVTPYLDYYWHGGMDVEAPEMPAFLASDFKLSGEMPEPVSLIRPKLL